MIYNIYASWEGMSPRVTVTQLSVFICSLKSIKHPHKLYQKNCQCYLMHQGWLLFNRSAYVNAYI